MRQGRMLPAQSVVNLGKRGTWRHPKRFGFGARDLPQPGKQTNSNGDRYGHEGILLSDEDVHFFP